MDHLSDLEVAELRPRLVRIALRYGRNMAEAEDLVHATFVKALSRSERLRPDTNWHAWAAVAIRNEVIDLARRDRTRQKQTVEMFVCAVDSTLPAYDADAEPPSQSWKGLSAADVSEALASCPAELSRAFQLRYLAGHSYAQIAAILNIPVRTVGTRLYRARLRLRQALLRVAEISRDCESTRGAHLGADGVEGGRQA